MPSKVLIALVVLVLPVRLWAQEDLLDILKGEEKKEKQMVSATFKGVRLINGHTIETRSKGNLEFIIQHRFGELNRGSYDFWGLDQAEIRLGLDYSILDNLTIGVGRSSFLKTYDGFAKWKALQQSKGDGAMPVSLTVLGTSAYETVRYDSGQKDETINRTSYSAQVLVARKFNSHLSMQLIPTVVHRNLVAVDEENQTYALGVGLRAKLTRRISLNVEYYQRLGDKLRENTYNPLSVGFDIETGGHVFQLHFSSARAMINEQLVPYSVGDFFSGDIHFGFNISRSFQLY